jgi:hypothetical protein
MEFYDVETDISAAPDAVWSILVNGAEYTSWDSGVAKVEGTVTEGGKIKVFSEISPGRAFPVKVALDRSAGRMTWTGGMPLGLFKGVRTFTISSRDGGSHFHMREEFTGPLLKLIWKSMPDLSASFQQFADGLKAEAESRA